MSQNPFDPESPDELPAQLPIFPLTGATLLPGTQLPLNVFEPRYLSMVLDALGDDRYIGMVQPDPSRSEEEPVPTYEVGCAGRIVAFNETPDGRLLISLQGVCRFRLSSELPLLRGYRRVEADWEPFGRDLVADARFQLDRESMREALSQYLEINGIRVDWDALDKMPDNRVVDFLSMHLPLEPEEKQALLEAPDTGTRATTLVTAAQMAVRTNREGGVEGGSTRH